MMQIHSLASRQSYRILNLRLRRSSWRKDRSRFVVEVALVVFDLNPWGSQAVTWGDRPLVVWCWSPWALRVVGGEA